MNMEEKFFSHTQTSVLGFLENICHWLQIFTRAFYWHGFPLTSQDFIDYNASKQNSSPQ